MAIRSFRLDQELEKKLDRLAYEEGKTKTEVIRDALAEYAARKRAPKRARSVREVMKNYIGAGSAGSVHLSEETGRTFKEILVEKTRAGRL
jgi:predicted transcriptional regulator